jgi:hypothetical protein
MTTQYLPYSVVNMLSELNVDPWSVTWNIKNDGMGVSLNLNWTFGNDTPAYQNRRQGQAPTINNWRWKKSPSTLRRDEARRETFSKQKTQEPCTSRSDIEQELTQSQVSVNVTNHDTGSVRSVTSQTDTVATVEPPVTKDAETSCFVPQTCESGYQTDNLSTYDAATQYVAPKPTQDIRQSACPRSTSAQDNSRQHNQGRREKNVTSSKPIKKMPEPPRVFALYGPVMDPYGNCVRVDQIHETKDNDFIYTVAYPDGPAKGFHPYHHPFKHRRAFEENQLQPEHKSAFLGSTVEDKFENFAIVKSRDVSKDGSIICTVSYTGEPHDPSAWAKNEILTTFRGSELSDIDY